MVLTHCCKAKQSTAEQCGLSILPYLLVTLGWLAGWLPPVFPLSFFLCLVCCLFVCPSILITVSCPCLCVMETKETKRRDKKVPFFLCSHLFAFLICPSHRTSPFPFIATKQQRDSVVSLCFLAHSFPCLPVPLTLPRSSSFCAPAPPVHALGPLFLQFYSSSPSNHPIQSIFGRRAVGLLVIE